MQRNFTVLDQSDTEDLIDLLRRQMKTSKERRFPRKRTIAAIFSMMVNKVEPVEAVLNQVTRNSSTSERSRRVVKAFENFKRTRHMLTYDDLLVRLREALEAQRRIARATLGSLPLHHGR